MTFFQKAARTSCFFTYQGGRLVYLKKDTNVQLWATNYRIFSDPAYNNLCNKETMNSQKLGIDSVLRVLAIPELTFIKGLLLADRRSTDMSDLAYPII